MVRLLLAQRRCANSLSYRPALMNLSLQATLAESFLADLDDLEDEV